MARGVLHLLRRRGGGPGGTASRGSRASRPHAFAEDIDPGRKVFAQVLDEPGCVVEDDDLERRTLVVLRDGGAAEVEGAGASGATSLPDTSPSSTSFARVTSGSATSRLAEANDTPPR